MNPYGYDNPGPFTLYRASNGKWGLVDANGVHLPAEFDRAGDRFSRSFNEIVTFDPAEGFELLAWFDPSEAWYNFTFDNPDYPEEYVDYIFHPRKYGVPAERALHIPLLRRCTSVPRWLLHCLEIGCTPSFNEIDSHLPAQMAEKHPELLNFAQTNALLRSTLASADVPDQLKATLWIAKVHLDYEIYWFSV